MLAYGSLVVAVFQVQCHYPHRLIDDSDCEDGIHGWVIPTQKVWTAMSNWSIGSSAGICDTHRRERIFDPKLTAIMNGEIEWRTLLSSEEQSLHRLYSTC